MFRTTKCSSSGRFYMQFYGISFMYAYKQSSRCKCVKRIQFVCSHKTQLSAKLSLFLSYNDMFRPTITVIVRLYMKPGLNNNS